MCFKKRLPLAASTRPLRGHLERRSLLFGNTAEVEILRRASPEELVPDRAGAAVFGSVTATGYDEVYGFRHERLHLFTPVWRCDRVGVAGYQHLRHLGAERFEIVAGQLRLRPLLANRHLVLDAPGTEKTSPCGRLHFLRTDAVDELIAGDRIMKAHSDAGVETLDGPHSGVGEWSEIASLGLFNQKRDFPRPVAGIHHHANRICESRFEQVDSDVDTSNRVAHPGEHRPL